MLVVLHAARCRWRGVCKIVVVVRCHIALQHALFNGRDKRQWHIVYLRVACLLRFCSTLLSFEAPPRACVIHITSIQRERT